MAGLMSKVAFASKVSILMKATSDDANPTPGYLYEDISKITYESSEYCEYMVEFLVDRLKKKSVHVKLKVLIVLRNILQKGNNDFARSLRKHSAKLQEMVEFSGAVDPLFGDSFIKSVRKTAADVVSILFDTDRSGTYNAPTKLAGPPVPVQQNAKMEGFGNTPAITEPDETGIFKAIYDKIKDTVPVLKSATTAALPTTSSNKDYSSVSGKAQKSIVNQPTDTTWYYPDDAGHNKNESILDVANSFGEKYTSNSGTNWLTKSPNYQPAVGITTQAEFKIDLHENEKKIVDEIVTPLGIRNQPTQQQKQEFLKRCKNLDREFIVNRLAEKLSEKDTRVQARSLIVIESLLQSQLPNIKDVVKSRCYDRLNMFATSSHFSTKNKAQKVLQLLDKDENSQLMPKEAVAVSAVGQSESLLDLSSQHSEDVFDGLQLQMPSKLGKSPISMKSHNINVSSNLDNINDKGNKLLDLDVNPFNSATWTATSNYDNLQKNPIQGNADSDKNFDFFTTPYSNKNEITSTLQNFSNSSGAFDSNNVNVSDFDSFQSNLLDTNSSKQSSSGSKDDFFSSFDQLKVADRSGTNNNNNSLIDDPYGYSGSPIGASNSLPASQPNYSLNLFDGLQVNSNTSSNIPNIAPTSSSRTNLLNTGDFHLNGTTNSLAGVASVTPSTQRITANEVGQQYISNARSNSYSHPPSLNQCQTSPLRQSGNMQSMNMNGTPLPNMSNQQYLYNNFSSPVKTFTPNNQPQFTYGPPGHATKGFSPSLQSQTLASANPATANSMNDFSFISQKNSGGAKRNDSFSFVQDAMKASIKK